jgi:hypothetical protein
MTMGKDYAEYCEEESAIADGTAMELRPCYLCYLEQTGEADLSPHADQGPLRGVLRHSTTPGPDPYDAVHLTCGHTLI